MITITYITMLNKSIFIMAYLRISGFVCTNKVIVLKHLIEVIYGKICSNYSFNLLTISKIHKKITTHKTVVIVIYDGIKRIEHFDICTTYLFKIALLRVITFPDPHESSYGADTTFRSFCATVRWYLPCDFTSVYMQ